MPRATPIVASVSLTQSVYERVRADVISCRLRPGQKIVIGELCKAHAVSLGAVREALSRLTSEGLVVAEPQRGFRAAPISEADLRQLTEARIHVECLCLRRAVEVGDVAWEARLVAAFHALSRTAEREGDAGQISEAWATAHAHYHAALVEACDNAWFLRMRSGLYTQAERYRRLSATVDRGDRDLAAEHRAIVDAALARDAGGAVQALQRHLAATTLILLDSGTVRDATATEAVA